MVRVSFVYTLRRAGEGAYRIRVLGGEVSHFPTKYEVVSSRPQSHGHVTSEQNEREHIPILKYEQSMERPLSVRRNAHFLATGLEKRDWVVSVASSGAKEGQEMEDFWG